MSRYAGSVRKRLKKLRALAWKRQRGQCKWCGKAVPKENCTADHFPKEHAKGGVVAWWNIVMSCKECNNKRSNAGMAKR